MIKVNKLQKGNKLLDFVSKASWFYEESLVTDYQINDTTSVLFLSLKFHITKPEYIHKRLRKLTNLKYDLMVIIVFIDIPNYENLICELFEIANSNNHTVIFTFSNEESGKYISTFGSTKNKLEDKLRPKSDDHIDKFLKSIKSVNKRDVEQIKLCCNNLNSFINMKAIEIEKLSGVGKKKAELIHKYLNLEFNKY